MIEDEHWLIGFTEGEGCFGSRQRKLQKRYPHFTLVNTDLSSIEKAKEILGVGSITIKPTTGRRRTCYSLTVENREGLERVRDFFQNRLRTDYKKKQFAIFERVLENCYLSPGEMFIARSHRTKASWANPEQRANRLRAMRSPEYREKQKVNGAIRHKSEVVYNLRLPI